MNIEQVYNIGICDVNRSSTIIIFAADVNKICIYFEMLKDFHISQTYFDKEISASNVIRYTLLMTENHF